MVDLKQYRTHAEIVVILLFMVSLGVNVVDNDQGYFPYACDKESVPDVFAYKLSRVNDDGIQRNAYYNRDNSRKYKVCSTGWYLLQELPETLETTCEPEIITKTVTASCPNVKVIKYAYINGEQVKYVCDGVGESALCERFDRLME